MRGLAFLLLHLTFAWNNCITNLHMNFLLFVDWNYARVGWWPLTSHVTEHEDLIAETGSWKESRKRRAQRTGDWATADRHEGVGGGRYELLFKDPVLHTLRNIGNFCRFFLYTKFSIYIHTYF
jgi:hypothetical protein